MLNHKIQSNKIFLIKLISIRYNDDLVNIKSPQIKNRGRNEVKLEFKETDLNNHKLKESVIRINEVYCLIKTSIIYS